MSEKGTKGDPQQPPGAKSNKMYLELSRFLAASGNGGKAVPGVWILAPKLLHYQCSDLFGPPLPLPLLVPGTGRSQIGSGVGVGPT